MLLPSIPSGGLNLSVTINNVKYDAGKLFSSCLLAGSNRFTTNRIEYHGSACVINDYNVINIENKVKRQGYTSNLSIDGIIIGYEKKVQIGTGISAEVREDSAGTGRGFSLHPQDCTNDWPSMFKTYKAGNTCVVEAANNNISMSTEQKVKHNVSANKSENNVPPLKSKIANFVAKFW